MNDDDLNGKIDNEGTFKVDSDETRVINNNLTTTYREEYKKGAKKFQLDKPDHLLIYDHVEWYQTE